nr:MAG TPA: hypothetical protein [Caudoviricetes sp.]
MSLESHPNGVRMKKKTSQKSISICRLYLPSLT